MRIKGLNNGGVDVSLNEGLDTVLIDSSALAVDLDEHGVNLLIQELRLLAEEMKSHREHAEAERLSDEGRLH